MSLTPKKLRIGTRGSRLALTQANMVCDLLTRAHPDLECEIIIIKTTGDWTPQQGEVRLSEKSGGKGLYIENIENALRESRVDVGVHSLKDVPTHIPSEFALDHFLQRGDARDAFISNKAVSLDELPEGAVVGTSSVRRQSVILNRRPDLKVTVFRGNVDTRLQKLAAGQVDAIILASVGLKRLGHEGVIASYIEPEAMLPAVGQGVVGIECRANDVVTHDLLDAISHMPTRLTSVAERTLLSVLDGSCGTPIGSYATFTDNNMMRLRGFIATPDGTEMFHDDETALVHTPEDARALGLRVGRSLKSLVPEAVLLAVVS